MTIKARYGLSDQLLVGLERLAKASLKEPDFEDYFTIHQKNLTAILFSVNCIEAKINELIAVFEIDERTVLHSNIKAILDIERKVTLKEKFNLICALLNEDLWNSSIEPFQSFEVIQSLRNEIVHYKGKFDTRGKIPNRFKNLLDHLSINVVDEDLWIQVILESKRLPDWILRKTKLLDSIINERILKNLDH